MDAGNSRIKSCLVAGQEMDPLPPLDTRKPLWDQMERHWPLESNPEIVVLSNVAGLEVGLEISKWVMERWKVPIFEIFSEAEAKGLLSGYTEPQSLGVDRWIALLGAKSRYPCPLMVVDLGTAVTIDVIHCEGRHLGGYILPGRRTMARALKGAAAGIEGEADFGGPLAQPGRDTLACIEAGISMAVLGAIERSYFGLAQVSKRSLTLVLTGGDADWARKGLSISCIVDERLVFHGMRELMEWSP